MYGFAPISSSPLSALIVPVGIIASGVQAVSAVGTVKVRTDQHLAVTGLGLVGSVGTAVVDAEANTAVTGLQAVLELGAASVTTDQILFPQGFEIVSALGIAEGFTGARAFPTGLTITSGLGNAVAQADSTQIAPSYAINMQLGVVGTDTTSNVYAVGVFAVGEVGDPHVIGHSHTDITGVQGNLYVGDVRVWVDIPVATDNDWHDILQTAIILDNAHTFGGAPMASLSIAGTLLQTLETDAEPWAQVPVEVETDWTNVIT